MSRVQDVEVGEDGSVTLNAALIHVASGQFDLGQPPMLTLHRLNIVRLSPVLEQCINLTQIDLSYNKLTNTFGLAALSEKLQRCDLRYNQLTGIDGVSSCKSLEVLKLEGNQISSYDVLQDLTELKQLRSLSLRERDGTTGANPVCAMTNQTFKTGYVTTMNRWFPNVRNLDGNYFLKEDANPKHIQGSGDDEYTMPKSQPWCTEETFKSTLYDSSKVGAASEKNFRAVLADAEQATNKVASSHK